MKLIVNRRTAYAYTGDKPFDPTLPCIAFVHGALNDHSVWALLARWFAHHGYSTLAVDLPGHMRSEGPPLPDVPAMADWLLNLIHAAGLQKMALVGHSMGSLVAMEAAARAPELATHLIMVGTAYPMTVSPALLDLARTQPLRAIDTVAAFSLSTSGTSSGAKLRNSARTLMRQVLRQQNNALLLYEDLFACDRYVNDHITTEKLCCPVTFVLGTKDQMTHPKKAQQLAMDVKAQVITLPFGHSLMAEAPEAVLNALKKVLTRPMTV